MVAGFLGTGTFFTRLGVDNPIWILQGYDKPPISVLPVLGGYYLDAVHDIKHFHKDERLN